MARRRGNHRSNTFLLVFAGCLLTTTPVWPHKAWGEASDFQHRLEAAIEQTKQELQQESERIDRENTARQTELTKATSAAYGLSGELVERRLIIARKQQELAHLRQQREALWTEQRQWEREEAEIASICRDVHRELSELARMLPASELRDEQDHQFAQLEKALDQADIRKAVSSTVALTASFLHEARTKAIYEAEIVDAHGKRQRAKLLRVGQSLFAYHIPSTGQTAVALSAPYEESGFRWQEALSADMQRSLVAVIEQNQSPDGLIWVPIDVTGRMTMTATLSNRTLVDRLRSGGVVMIPLALVAVCLALLIADRFLVLMRQGRHSLRFCDRVLRLCSQGQFEQAQQLAQDSQSVLSRTLAVCLTHRNSPPALLDDAIQETLLQEFPKLERFLPSIRMLSSVAPMLGLLGTVTGIIATFDVITVVGTGQPRLMAGGIAEALITTATGLAIAIPGLLAHSVLAGKVDSIIADTERFAATLSNLVKREQHTTANNRNRQSDVRETLD
ncbi:MAG: MotA/TolQ/ExbB proton channel family protein [Phycisphaerales bacterium]|nr:MAG: MotA/TolQ/ExbB proton channel family protein [Phycisphaerales bacterium]